MRVIYLAFCFSMLLGCSPLKKIQQENNLSQKCAGELTFLTTYVQKSNSGLHKLALKTKADTATFERKLAEMYYQDMMGVCWFTVLSQEQVKTLFGTPNKITVSARDKTTTYKYFIENKQCLNSASASNASEKCGLLRFQFDTNNMPIKGTFEPFPMGIH